MEHKHKETNRQQTFGLFILMAGVITFLISCLLGFPEFDPNVSLFIIGGIWIAGGTILMVTS